MAWRSKSAGRGGIAATVLCAAAFVAVPSAGFALVAANDLRAGFVTFTPASVDARLARLAGSQRGGELMRFTPAGANNRQGRSVTVAVRIDESVAEALSVRTALGVTGKEPESAVAGIAPTRFNLGVARGFQSFARAPALSRDLSEAAIPDLAAFRPSPATRERPSRFAARIAVEDNGAGGRSARASSSASDQSFDLGGSYRVTRNLDVTAGVRYSQDLERIAPLTNGKQDSQAVYVGTQFRF